MSKAKLWAIIPAAGSGQRFSKTALKQYQRIAGKTVLEHSVTALARLPLAGCIIVIHEEDTVARTLHFDPSLSIQFCIGGKERMHSVLSALYHLETIAQHQDYVLVHDAARPCLHQQTIEQIADFCVSDADAAIVATPVRDTLKLAEKNQLMIAKTVNREQMWQAQTPQIVKYGLLHHALTLAEQHQYVVTDEASALEWQGIPVKLITGRQDNIKITYPEDLFLAEMILKSHSMG